MSEGGGKATVERSAQRRSGEGESEPERGGLSGANGPGVGVRWGRLATSLEAAGSHIL